jgi:hypothetical protein
MPVEPGEYEIRPDGEGKFEVYNTKSGEVHSKHATEDNAKHQRQLLYAVGHGWEPSRDGQ